jgi:hypothetical protein
VLLQYCNCIRDLFFPILRRLEPEIESIIDVSRIPQKLIETELNIIAKASFGFGMLTAASF